MTLVASRWGIRCETEGRLQAPGPIVKIASCQPRRGWTRSRAVESNGWMGGGYTSAHLTEKCEHLTYLIKFDPLLGLPSPPLKLCGLVPDEYVPLELATPCGW